MTDEVRVSWQGTQELVQLTHDQYLNLSDASGFMCSAQLSDTGAFSGFLSLFKGTYQEALDAVTASVNDAMTGAQRLSDRIADAREHLRQTDHNVETLHTKLEEQVGCQSYTPGSGDDIPQVPDNLVNANNLLDHVETPMSGPPVPDFVQHHAGSTPAAPLDLIDNTASLIDNASDTGDGMDHADDADDFVEAHR
jgi:hypothetical protein